MKKFSMLLLTILASFMLFSLGAQAEEETSSLKDVLPSAGFSVFHMDEIIDTIETDTEAEPNANTEAETEPEAQVALEDVLISAGFSVLGDDNIPEEIVKNVEILDDPAYQAREQDIDYLSRIIYPEAGSDCIPFSDKVGVGLTVLHRVDSENITAPEQYAEIYSGEIPEECREAAEFAMQLWESGLSYAFLPSQYLYFTGDGTGKHNKFHDFHGHYYKLPDLEDPETQRIFGPITE